MGDPAAKAWLSGQSRRCFSKQNMNLVQFMKQLGNIDWTAQIHVIPPDVLRLFN